MLTIASSVSPAEVNIDVEKCPFLTETSVKWVIDFENEATGSQTKQIELFSEMWSLIFGFASISGELSKQAGTWQRLYCFVNITWVVNLSRNN